MSEINEIVDLLRWMAEHDVTMEMERKAFGYQLTLRQDGLLPIEESVVFDKNLFIDPYFDGAIVGTFNRLICTFQKTGAETLQRFGEYVQKTLHLCGLSPLS